jgi:hypothetical protein
MSFLGSSPTVGRPTRRMDESCLSESSGISEKPIFFDFIPFSFFPARAPRADDPRGFFIVFFSLKCTRSVGLCSNGFWPTANGARQIQSAPSLHRPSRPDQGTLWRPLRMTRRFSPVAPGLPWIPIKHRLCIYNIQPRHKHWPANFLSRRTPFPGLFPTFLKHSCDRLRSTTPWLLKG